VRGRRRRDGGSRPAPGERDDLAADGPARARQAARLEPDPAREPFGAAQVDERAADRSPAQEDRLLGPARHDACERPAGLAGKRFPTGPLGRRNAEPDGSNGTGRLRELGDAARDAPVLGDEAPGEDGRERRRRGRKTQRHEACAAETTR
jgi:hypothetical protein